MKITELFILAILVAVISTPAEAVPLQINFQGRLTDSAGQPLTGMYTISFGLYDTNTGGTAKWAETQNSISMVNGMINVVIGSSVTVTPEILSAGDLWLEIKVENDILQPRQKLVSSPYAIAAENSNKLSGRTYDMFLSTGGGTVNGPVIIQGSGTVLQVVGVSSFTGVMTVNSVYNPTVPRGGIIMYSGVWNFDASGLGTGVLSGWALCNGNNSTPNLSEKFVMVSTTSAGQNSAGGNLTHSHSLLNTEVFFGPQTGDVSYISPNGGRRVSYSNSAADMYVSNSSTQRVGYSGNTPAASDTAIQNLTLDTAAVTSTVNHQPPFFKLAFIMKL
ncbi:MAG: hypothetical protein WC955_11255 [Elusimicrobiota bacterium]